MWRTRELEHLCNSKCFGTACNIKKKTKMYLDNGAIRTRWCYCPVPTEISLRAGMHGDVTVHSDGSCMTWRGRQEIGYGTLQDHPGRGQKGERKLSIENLVFLDAGLCYKGWGINSLFFFLEIRKTSQGPCSLYGYMLPELRKHYDDHWRFFPS